MFIFFTFLIPLMVAGAIMIAGIGICAKWPRAQLSWTLAGLHATVVGLVFLPAVFGKGFPDIPFDDLYMPFMIYPGWPVWALCGILSHSLLNWLFSNFSPHTASVIGLIWIPATFALLLGGSLWFFVGHLAGLKVKERMQAKQDRTASHTSEGIRQPADGSSKPSM